MEKLFPGSFLKSQNWTYLWINSLKLYIFCFYCMSSWGLSKHIETKLQTTSLYLFKNKKRSGTSFPGSFSTWFLKKNISFVILYYLTKFHCLVAFTSWDIGQYVYSNCFLTRLWRHKFWNYPCLSNKAGFSTWPKSQGKNLNIMRAKWAFKMKEKTFFIIFKGLSLKQIKQFFLEGESPTLMNRLTFYSRK